MPASESNLIDLHGSKTPQTRSGPVDNGLPIDLFGMQSNVRVACPFDLLPSRCEASRAVSASVRDTSILLINGHFDHFHVKNFSATDRDRDLKTGNRLSLTSCSLYSPRRIE